MVGGPGVDTLDGAKGNDVFVYDTIADFVASGLVIDSIIGGSETDAIVINDKNSYNLSSDNFSSRVSSVEILSQGSATSSNVSIALDSSAFSTTGIKIIDLSADSDTAGVNSVDASTATVAQPLSLFGSAGIDSIVGGAGDDSITGSGAADTLIGGAGNDTFAFTNFGDFVSSDALVDSIQGGNGLADVFLLNVSTAINIPKPVSLARASVVEVLRQGTVNTASIDIRLNTDAFTAGIRTIDLSGDTNAIGLNVVDASNASATQSLYLVGSSGNDSLIGGSSTDTIEGGSGNDSISGGSPTAHREEAEA